MLQPCRKQQKDSVLTFTFEYVMAIMIRPLSVRLALNAGKSVAVGLGHDVGAVGVRVFELVAGGAAVLDDRAVRKRRHCLVVARHDTDSVEVVRGRACHSCAQDRGERNASLSENSTR